MGSPATGRARAARATRSRFGSTRRIRREGSCRRRGRITRFRPPLGPGVRLDTHVFEGYAVPSTYDSLLAKLIVWDEDRPRASRARGPRPRRARARGRPDDARPRRRDRGRATTSARAATRPPISTTRPGRSRRSARRERPSRSPPPGALPALPVGRDRPAARLALRGRGRPVRAGSRRGGQAQHATDLDRRITAAARGLDGRPARRGRAQRPPDGHLRARPRRGVRSRSRSTRPSSSRSASAAGDAPAPRQRHPRANRREAA